MTTATNKAWLALDPVACAVIATASLVAPAWAADLTTDEVHSAVETWVRHVTADARPDAVIEWLEPHAVDGRTVAYIAHLAGGGYCLCGADDLVLPVYLYRPVGTPSSPYRGIDVALQEAPDDVALVLKAGSMNTFSAGLLTIDRPMTLKGYDVTIEVTP